MQQINQAFPPEDWRRYNELIAMRQEETLATDEYAELLRLSDRYEAHDAARIVLLANLT